MMTCSLAVLGLMVLLGVVLGDVRSGARLRQARLDPVGYVDEGCLPEDFYGSGTARCLTKNSACVNMGNGNGQCDCDDKANPPFTLSPQFLSLQSVDKYCDLNPSITQMSKTVCEDDRDCELYDNTVCLQGPANLAIVKRCVCKANTEPNPPTSLTPGCSVFNCKDRPSYCFNKDRLMACQPSPNPNSSQAYSCECRPGAVPNPANNGRCQELASKPCTNHTECDSRLPGSTCHLRSQTCVCSDTSKNATVQGTLIYDAASPTQFKCKANGYASLCFDNNDCNTAANHRCYIKPGKVNGNSVSLAGQCVCPENQRPPRRNMQECQPTFGLCCRSTQDCGVLSSTSGSLQCNGFNCVCPPGNYRWNAITKICEQVPAFGKCDW